MNKCYEAPKNCKKCIRLFNYRNTIMANNPSWHNKPVKSFGSINSKILIVGLAPGKKGANRTGRPFTGDGAGETLFNSLIKHNLAIGDYDINAEDNLTLIDCRITNIVKCVPPKNRPTGEEFNNCKQFLKNEIKEMNNLKKILALGRDAYNTIIQYYELPKTKYLFKHYSIIKLPDKKILVGSYHCSRYNTNTKRLTNEMFDDVINYIKKS